MSALAQAATEYLQMRRALGYKLEREGRDLPRFVEFLERKGTSVITTEPAVLAVISVMLLNSETAPVARTRCPSATAVGHELQKMKMPSEVSGSASAWASSSWRKKPCSLLVPW